MMKFQLGQIAATHTVNSNIEQSQQFALFVAKCIDRHMQADWGDVPNEDAQMNELALQQQNRIMSVYKIADATIGEQALWIITESDRSVTTLLFPSEY